MVKKKYIVCPFLYCLWLSLGYGPSLVQGKLNAAKTKEYEVKAAFIYNILKFIDWPKEPSAKQESAEEEKEDKPKQVFTIGFVADKEIFEACKAIRGKKIKGKTIRTILFDSLTEKDLKKGDKSKRIQALKGCDILFVCAPQDPKSRQADFRNILKVLKGLPILTIGEMNGFIRQVNAKYPCGIINFVIKEHKVRFEINLEMAQASGFQMKAQLLTLATKVIKKAKPSA